MLGNQLLLSLRSPTFLYEVTHVEMFWVPHYVYWLLIVTPPGRCNTHHNHVQTLHLGALFVVVTLASPSVSYSCLRKNLGWCITAEIRAATCRWAAPVLTSGMCQCCSTRHQTLGVTCLGSNNNSELKSICCHQLVLMLFIYLIILNVNQTLKKQKTKQWLLLLI